MDVVVQVVNAVSAVFRHTLANAIIDLIAVPPPISGVVVVGAGVDHRINGVMMGQERIRSTIIAIKSEL